MCKKTASTDPHRHELFRTEHGCVYQSDAERMLHVEFAGKTDRYDIRCFQRLKKAVFGIDLVEMATNPRRTNPVEIIALRACEHCYVVTLPEIMAFRDLLEGAAVMLELNAILQERLFPHPASA